MVKVTLAVSLNTPIPVAIGNECFLASSSGRWNHVCAVLLIACQLPMSQPCELQAVPHPVPRRVGMHAILWHLITDLWRNKKKQTHTVLRTSNIYSTKLYPRSSPTHTIPLQIALPSPSSAPRYLSTHNSTPLLATISNIHFLKPCPPLRLLRHDRLHKPRDHLLFLHQQPHTVFIPGQPYLQIVCVAVTSPATEHPPRERARSLTWCISFTYKFLAAWHST